MPLTLQQLYDYDHWANEECLKSLRALPAPPARALALFAHAMATKRNHLARCKGETPPAPFFPEWDLEQSAAMMRETDALWREYLPILTDEALDGEFDFRSVTRGGTYRVSRAATVQTVLFHGAYHRGQIAALVREAGGQPASTDLIFAPEIGSRRVRD